MTPRFDRTAARFIPFFVALSVLAAACSGGSVASDSDDTAVEVTTAPPSTVATLPPTTATPEAAIEGCAGLPTGFSDITLDAGGAAHSIRVYVPTSFDGTEVPAVLNWHGLGSSGLEQVALSNYETLAEAEGFVVAHATGVADPTSGRNSWELIDEQDPNRDDLAFADALIDELVDRWCVDEKRVYSTGMSNGGFFTARLVCERSERIAAAVSVAGTSHQPDCDPARPVPYLAYHGTDDDLVPFDGNGQSSLLDGIDDERLREFFTQVMPDEFAEFAHGAGCAVEPSIIQVSDEVTEYEYLDCVVPMNFIEISNGGHTWPGSPLGALLVDTLGFTTTDVSATADGWAFMSQFSL